MARLAALVTMLAVAPGCSPEGIARPKRLLLGVKNASQRTSGVQKRQNLFEQAFRSLSSGMFFQSGDSFSDVSDFNCFAVNVTGAGVESHNLFSDRCSSLTSMNDKGFGTFSPPFLRNDTVDIDVTAGLSRGIDIYGLYPLPPECGGTATESKGFFLGGVSQDLVDDTSVEVPISFSGSPADFSCGDACQLTGVSELMDLFGLDSSGSGGLTQALTEDFSANIFAGGSGVDDFSATHWMVRKGSGSGADWSTADDFLPSGWTGATGDGVRAMARDSYGTVYAAGGMTEDGSHFHWLVRGSDDSGESWHSLDDVVTATASNSAMAMAVAPDDTLYVAGLVPSAGGTWTVRRSSDLGGTWTTADSFNPGSGSGATGIAIDSQGVIFVVGNAIVAGKSHLVTRSSSDNGATWATVDDFQLNGAISSFGAGGGVDDSDNIFALGFETSGHWFARRSIDGGATWTTVDSFQYAAGKLSSPSALAFDNAGGISVVGSATDSANVVHFIVRKSDDGGGTWGTSEDFQFESGFDASGLAAYVDDSGNVFAAGSADDSSGSTYSVVNRRSCQ
ncbi:MAG: hypothetical protein HY074_03400 [Deltaproteobacteria bacterium]|nr:hypothetical protein [Deltaproteobacteria bacterium]